MSNPIPESPQATTRTNVVSIQSNELLTPIDSTVDPRWALRKVANFLQAFAAGGKMGTVDIQDGATSALAAAAGGTIAFTSVAAGNVLAVNGVLFFAVSGTPLRSAGEFKVGVSNTADAADFATTFNASTNAAVAGYLVASAASGTVTIAPSTTLFPPVSGGATNAVTVETLGILASSSGAYSGSSGTQTVTINGVAITASSGASDTLTAAAMATAINSSANALVKGFVYAYNNGATLNVFSLYPGLTGNSIQCSSSGTGNPGLSGRLTGGTLAQNTGAQASGQVTIASGSGNETVTINGVAIVTAWATSDTATAAAIATAINGSTNSLVRDFVYASSAAGVVTITARAGGVKGNAITLAASGTGCSVTTAWAGGAAPTQAVLGSVAASSSFPGGRLTGGVNGASNALTW